MKALVCQKYGASSPELVRDWPQPLPKEKDLLIQVKAASINPVDWKIMQGKLKLLLPLNPPFVTGNDGAGIVSAVGSAVTKFKPGDEVFFRPRKEDTGTFAEYCCVREDEAAVRPGNITWNEAASLPLVALTSWQALFDKAELRANQKILIHAGSGGVGTIAIQLARNAGAYVATTCGPSGMELAKKMGADQIINYREKDFAKLLENYDVVFDTIGGTTLEKSFQVLKPGGVLVTITGIPTPDIADRYGRGVILRTLFWLANRGNRKSARKTGVRFEYLLMDANGDQLSEIARLVEKGIVVPVVDKVFSVQDAGAAFEYQMSGHTKGKVVLAF